MARDINFGSSEADAKYQISDDGTPGDFVLARDTNGATVLLQWSATAGQWEYGGPVDMDGNDLIDAGTTVYDASADTVGDGTTSADHSAVTTEDLNNAIGDAAIQASFDGLVVPISEGLGMSDAIDPSNTATPLQDAADAVRASTGVSGTVLLPPQTINEGSTFNPRSAVAVVGWGPNTSIVDFSNASGTAWNFDDTAISESSVSNVTYHNFQIKGPGVAGTDMDFIQVSGTTTVSRVEWGWVWFRDAHGSVLKVPDASNVSFDWNIQWWDARSFDAGDKTAAIDIANMGPNIAAHKLHFTPDASQSTANTQTLSPAGVTSLQIKNLIVAGSTGMVYDDSTVTSPGQIHINHVHYEPGSQQSTPQQLFNVRRCNRFSIESIHWSLGSATYAYTVGASAGNVTLPRPTASSGSLNNLDMQGKATLVRYEGTKSEVDVGGAYTGQACWSEQSRKWCDPDFEGTRTLSGGSTPANTMNTPANAGETGQDTIPRIQDHWITSGVNADYSWQFRPLWDDSAGGWDLEIVWGTDPGGGNDPNMHVEVVTRPAPF